MTKNWDGEAFTSIEVKSKKIKGLSVDLHWECGEGVSGDYDETDPQDEPLLRFDVLFNGEQLEDSSYCTNLRADDDPKLLKKAVAVILGEAEDSKTGDEEYNHGFHFKKRGERLSWIGIENGRLV
jgi:hypothetical protein